MLGLHWLHAVACGPALKRLCSYRSQVVAHGSFLAFTCGCRIVAAWAGDSRAVVGVRGSSGKGYQAHQLTADHKPESPSELARIAAAGGRVDRVATDAQGNPMGESGHESGSKSGHALGQESGLLP